jgi:hypothetical protein
MPEFLSGGREFKSLQAHPFLASRVSGSFPKPETDSEAKKMWVRGSFSTRFGTSERQEKQGSGLDFQDFLKHANYLSNTISKNKL